MTVFADAFFWIALLNRRDEYHERARLYLNDFQGTFLTTQWVLAEVADAMASSAVRRSIQPFIQEIAVNQAITVVDATPDLFLRGINLYHERPDKHWSLTDCISFVVMTDHGLSEALTGDHHFAQAGFRPVFS
jgi:predicted nucleic acid-binding protein